MTNDPTWLLHECVSSSVWRELKISSKMGEVLSVSNTTDPSCFVLLQLEEEGPQACTGGFGRSVALDGGKEGGGEGGTRGERRGAGEVQIRAMQILSEEVVYQWLTFSSDFLQRDVTPWG